MDLYCKLGSALREMFRGLFDLKQKEATVRKMEEIVQMASQISPQLEREARGLQREIEGFLDNPRDGRLMALMKRHALHLEQETREL